MTEELEKLLRAFEWAVREHQYWSGDGVKKEVEASYQAKLDVARAVLIDFLESKIPD